jgi:hypothetical protein
MAAMSGADGVCHVGGRRAATMARGQRARDGAHIYIPPGALDLYLRCNRELAGGVIGGAVGGVLGSQVGEGDGGTVATIGGALIGVLVGGAIGRQMDQAD